MSERPRAMDTPLSGSFEDMLGIVEGLDTPAGYKAELIRGKIVVSPWSKLRYKKVMKELRLQLEQHAPEGHDVDVAPFLFTFPGSERGYGPDLHVADETAFEVEGRHADGAALSLAAELTSDSAKDVDRLDKMATYGQIVPVYLLLDMRVGEINVMWDPSPKGYRSRTDVPFGHPVRIPAPFDFELDTSGFGVPEEQSAEEEQR
ncbi:MULTISPECIES: Uma2 family endonuclease [unclassified Streptomyces]|uniref:Uma2 family endonuclease n=1 Tax=unclassified Streptomyces TaxID=2593676 RepID=UPI0029BF8D86|nr:Uma2 family endonuclease [Streptomyces sp. FL07-04A]MDX3577681.1 Uma2 family endonuclease [Streptomyces sp. FL07-04A]